MSVSTAGSILVLTYFPLLGVFAFLRHQGAREVGYLIFVLPLMSLALLRLLDQLFGRGTVSHRRGRADQWYHGRTFIGYCVIVLFGFVHAYLAGSRPLGVALSEFTLFAVIVAFWIVVIREHYRGGADLNHLAEMLSLSLMMYLLLNVVGVAVGIRNSGLEATYTREFEAMLSWTGYRIVFPFVASGRLFSVEAGVVVLFSGWWLRKNNFRARVTGVLMLTLGAIVLVGHSARMPILALVGVGCFSLLRPRVGRVAIILALGGILAIPIFLVYWDFGRMIESVLGVVGERITRAQGDLATFSNRDVIWSECLYHMFRDAGLGNVFFGYGAYGQISSGIVDYYSYLFSYSYADSSRVTVHNSYIQVLVDYGLVGLSVFIAAWVRVAHGLAELGSTREESASMANTLSLVLLYLALCSVTEIVTTYYSPGVLSLFIVLNVIVLMKDVRSKGTSTFGRKASTVAPPRVVTTGPARML